MANSRWIKDNDWTVFGTLRLPLPWKGPAKISKQNWCNYLRKSRASHAN